ncbi:MAG: tetratricopeptide repeat protein, partial [Candidatus Brocadiae bacterium]|nr:tetratricopeptide repeat protein [Candidatus Brocadiia bacterium]
VETARQLARAGEPDAAIVELQAAVQLSPGHAETHFRLAERLEQRGRYQDAAGHYEAARNLDTVRWRAGTDWNELIRDIVRRADDDLVLLADAAAYLEQRAEHGLPGSTLFLEHVHPTLKGNFAIAEAVARTIGDSPAAAQPGAWHWQRHGAFDSYAAANGIDVLDVIIALQQAAVLHRQVLPPQNGTSPQYRNLLMQIAELQGRLSGAHRAAWDEAAEAGAFERDDYYDRLRLLLTEEYAERGQFEDALREVDKARRYGVRQLDNTRYAEVFLARAAILLRAGSAEPAVAAAQRALALDPTSARAKELLSHAKAALEEQGAAEARDPISLPTTGSGW